MCNGIALLLLLSLSVTFVHSCGVPRVLDNVVLVSAKWHCTGIHAEYVYFPTCHTTFRLQMGPRAWVSMLSPRPKCLSPSRAWTRSRGPTYRQRRQHLHALTVAPLLLMKSLLWRLQGATSQSCRQRLSSTIAWWRLRPLRHPSIASLRLLSSPSTYPQLGRFTSIPRILSESLVVDSRSMPIMIKVCAWFYAKLDASLGGIPNVVQLMKYTGELVLGEKLCSNYPSL